MRLHALLRFLSTVGLVFCFWGEPVRAQPPDESIVKGFGPEKRSRFEGEKEGLLNQKKPLTSEDQAIIRAAARYYVQRVALLAYSGDPKKLREFLRDFERVVNKAKEAKNQQAKQAFAKECIKALQAILGPDKGLPFNQWRTAVLFASYELEPLGRLGRPEVADYLADLVEKSKNDLPRLFALKGLRECFQASQPEIHSFTSNEDRLRQARWLEAILTFLNRPQPKAEEDEGAFLYIRREAIKALAEARLPVVPLLDSKEIKAPVAYGLMRVLVEGKEGLSPPPTLSEKVEAVLGLCQLKSDVEPRPQAKLVLKLVGTALVDLSRAYLSDQVNFRKTKGSLPPLLPWKYYGMRLKQALQELPTNQPDAAKAGALQLAQAAAKILTAMSSRTNIEDSDIQALQETVQGLAAPNSSVYEGRPEPKIELMK
jgi:hypothetical protein